jgi:hypothetical protein
MFIYFFFFLVTPILETQRIKRTKRNETVLFSFIEKLNATNRDLIFKDYDQTKIIQEIDDLKKLGSNIVEYKNEYDNNVLHEVFF